MFFDYKKTAAFSGAAIFIFIFDRFLKFLAVNNFFFSDSPGSGLFGLNFIGNSKIAFSLPASGAWLVATIFLVIIFATIFFIRLWRKNDERAFYLFFIILGGASNLYDRLRFGYVIDYLDVKYFTVFNLADAMIVAGVLGFILVSQKGVDKKEAIV